MYLLPAIDILDGRAVRLEQGDYSKVTVYNEDPVLQAQLFEEAGAEWLHLVDLDGARSGQPANIAVVEAILRRTALKVEVGGGVRSMDAIARLADAGANRVVLGPALVRQRDFAQQAVEEYEGLLTVADGLAACRGTLEAASLAAEQQPHTLADLEQR